MLILLLELRRAQYCCLDFGINKYSVIDVNIKNSILINYFSHLHICAACPPLIKTHNLLVPNHTKRKTQPNRIVYLICDIHAELSIKFAKNLRVELYINRERGKIMRGVFGLNAKWLDEWKIA